MKQNGLNYSEGLLCAGGNEKGSCQVRKIVLKSLNQTKGDSGGALTVDGVLAGLVSRGGSDICAKVTFSFFISWFNFCFSLGECV